MLPWSFTIEDVDPSVRHEVNDDNDLPLKKSHSTKRNIRCNWEIFTTCSCFLWWVRWFVSLPCFLVKSRPREESLSVLAATFQTLVMKLVQFMSTYPQKMLDFLGCGDDYKEFPLRENSTVELQLGKEKCHLTWELDQKNSHLMGFNHRFYPRPSVTCSVVPSKVTID